MATVNIRKHARFLCVVMAILLMLAAMTGCNSNPQPQTGPSNETQGGTEPPAASGGTEATAPLVTAPEDEPYVEPPTQPPVQVVMPEYEMSYSGDLADIISWEEAQEQGGLSFFVQIEGEKCPLFTLLLNQIQGELVTMKTNGAGEQIPVSFIMEQIPQGLSEENTRTFCVAQDLVNEIIASLVLK